jgi:4-hydroxybenzoate polyprenyltransferase
VVGQTIAFLAVASTGLYFFGMSLNDIADLEKDKVSAPGKVLPSGRISPGAAKVACAVPLIVSFGSLLLSEGTSRPLWLAAWGSAVFFICAYDLFLKIPPAMGLVRASNLLLGVFLALEPGTVKYAIHLIIANATPTFIYITALTYVSTLEDGPVSRVRVATGAGFMVLGAGLAPFILPLAAGLRLFGGWDSSIVKYISFNVSWWHPVPFTAALSGWILYRTWKAVDRKGVMLLVRDGIGGVIFLDAGLMTTLHEHYDYWIPWAVAALVLPAIASVAIFKKLA